MTCGGKLLVTSKDNNLLCTGCLQMNGAVSKVNKKFISHLTRAKRTLLAAATVQVSHALPAVRSLVLTAGPVSKMALQQEKAFCVLCFEVSRSVITVQCALHCMLHCKHRSGYLKMEHTESLYLLQRHLGNWPCDPTVSMRSELLVAHEKLGQLPLLTVYVVPV